MNDEALFKRFDLVADLQGNMPLIRRYIVDLAIRGRLGKTSPGQPSADEMLQRISLRAAELARDGSIKKQKPLSPIEPNELPVAYAEHCTFERLGNISTLIKGRTGIQAAQPGPYPLVVTAADRASCDHYDFEGVAAIIPMVSSTGHGNASLNRLHYQEGRFALGTILCAVFPIDETLISARFLFEYLTAFKEELLVSRMIGTANVSLTIAKIAEVSVPILPPATQQRVEELMTLCDQLETAQQEREHRRDRLAAAVLQRLSLPVETGSPEIRREHINFYLQQIPRLTGNPEHIKAFRQAIINQAIQGQLVPQDAKDEPVTVLLERMRCDIQRYGEENRVQPAAVEAVKNDSPPFALPSGWLWARLASVCRVITDGDHLPPPKSADGVAFLTIGNISAGALDFSNCRYVPRDYFDKIAPYRRPENGDLLYTVVGATYGRPVIVDTSREFCVQRHIAIIKPAQEMSRRYLHLLLMSPFGYAQATRCLTGTAQPTVPLRPLRNFLVPLPSLAEQHRIVDKVAEFMCVCDQIEVQLDATQTNSRRLLESLFDHGVGISSTATGSQSHQTLSTSNIPEYEQEKGSHYMMSNPAMTVDQLIECIDDLGGTATPERLLTHSGLSEDLETFFDLLRTARDSSALKVALGSGETIQRPSNAH